MRLALPAAALACSTLLAMCFLGCVSLGQMCSTYGKEKEQVMSARAHREHGRSPSQRTLRRRHTSHATAIFQRTSAGLRSADVGAGAAVCAGGDEEEPEAEAEAGAGVAGVTATGVRLWLDLLLLAASGDGGASMAASGGETDGVEETRGGDKVVEGLLPLAVPAAALVVAGAAAVSARARGRGAAGGRAAVDVVALMVCLQTKPSVGPMMPSGVGRRQAQRVAMASCRVVAFAQPRGRRCECGCGCIQQQGLRALRKERKKDAREQRLDAMCTK